MRVTAKLLLAGLFGMGLAASAQAQGQSDLVSGHYVADPAHSSIHFISNHLGFSTFVGRFNDFDTSLNFDADNPENSQLSVTVDPGSIDADNEMFTQHLSSGDFFNVAEYPEATFKSTDIDVTGEGTGEITGDLTMLGVTRSVTLDAELVGAGKNPMSEENEAVMGIDAQTTINRSEWGIDYLVPMIPDEVDLRIHVELHRQGDVGDM